jgi:large subunit ribosomal protein L22
MSKSETKNMAAKNVSISTDARGVSNGVSKASLMGYNQSPRKVRLVTDLMKGKKVSVALEQLAFLPKRAALPIKKLIESAVANAKANGEDVEKLRVKNITVDSDGMMVRYMPRAMGRATPIRRKKSRVSVTLA